MHNTPEQNKVFRRAWDATNARWKAQTMQDQQPSHSSTPAEIIDYYDRHPNLTLSQFAQITGLTVAQLKRILQA